MSALAFAVPPDLAFDSAGLVPVVVQDRASGDVLMLAYASQQALERTVETGFAHFWSRSRKALWKKGETSGHVLRVSEMHADCDKDALLMIVEPLGPTCHTGTRACFGDASSTSAGLLFELARLIKARKQEAPEGSYTAKLFAKGLDHMLKKLGEETTEVVLAAKGESDARLAEETADLLFHLLVALEERGMALESALDVLRRRRRAE